MARLKKVDGERGLYKDPGSGTYFVRVYHNGKDTFRSLETARIREALERLDAAGRQKLPPASDWRSSRMPRKGR